MKIKVYVKSIRKASDFIRAHSKWSKPEIGIILGSGLSKAVPPLEQPQVISYAEIPGFPRNTVPGHAGKLILGKFAGKQVAVMQGRFHYFEGHSMESITLPVRMLEYLGLKTLVATAAVGSMRPQIKLGDFIVIKDHINFMGRNPLRGFHEEEFGEMFPDLTNAYDVKFRQLAMSLCRKRKIPAHEGVYVATGGPSYETPAEIKAFRIMGGDVVGMSTVPEIIVAKQMGLRAMAVAWNSNMASGLAGASLSHPEVLELGQKVAVNIRLFLQDFIKAV